ncbi:MAG TPA: arginase family protein [Candidatus Scybalocola faecigallinarum]|uniref:Arginase family protein n=1 Tax=Candidatus Scybalocola faecigallinarum TaxID=2840941 RepID=A0A9D1F326_9FIRM|nr:arginase family protein [Candidatus Scybalocola faecigallinarum]
MYSIYGCPMHYGVGDEGLMYSLDYLNQYYDLSIPVVPEITMPENNLSDLKNLNSVVSTCWAIAKYQHHVIRHKDIPLFIAGDRSAVIGSVSATSANYENLGLIWISAFPDMHTQQTLASGNIREMSVSALLGMGEKSLTNILTSQIKIRPENIVMLGLQKITPSEKQLLKELKIKYYTYEETCRMGLTACIQQSIQYLDHLDAIHLSFSLDAMDPALIPGVSLPADTGFNLADIYQMFTYFLKELPVAAIDITEFNMAHDVEHHTSDFIYSLIGHIMELGENDTLIFPADILPYHVKHAFS